LVKLPASSSETGVNAGMSFTMLRGVEPLLKTSEEHVLREQLTGLAKAAGGISGLPNSIRDRLNTLIAELLPKLTPL
jgi:hypothetical protein